MYIDRYSSSVQFKSTITRIFYLDEFSGFIDAFRLNLHQKFVEPYYFNFVNEISKDILEKILSFKSIHISFSQKKNSKHTTHQIMLNIFPEKPVKTC